MKSALTWTAWLPLTFLSGCFLVWAAHASSPAGRYTMTRVDSPTAIHESLQGHILYDELHTQYGPGFFLLHHVVFGTLGWEATHDVVRWWSLGFWLGSVGLLTAGFEHLDHSSRHSLDGPVVVSGNIHSRSPIPAHPHGILLFLMGRSRGRGVSPAARSCPGRGRIGLALMIKINVGGLLLLALTWTVLLADFWTGGGGGCVGALEGAWCSYPWSYFDRFSSIPSSWCSPPSCRPRWLG